MDKKIRYSLCPDTAYVKHPGIEVNKRYHEFKGHSFYFKVRNISLVLKRHFPERKSFVSPVVDPV